MEKIHFYRVMRKLVQRLVQHNAVWYIYQDIYLERSGDHIMQPKRPRAKASI